MDKKSFLHNNCRVFDFKSPCLKDWILIGLRALFLYLLDLLGKTFIALHNLYKEMKLGRRPFKITY